MSVHEIRTQRKLANNMMENVSPCSMEVTQTEWNIKCCEKMRQSLNVGDFVSPFSASCLAALVCHGGMDISGVCTPVICQAVGCRRKSEIGTQLASFSDSSPAFLSHHIQSSWEEPGSEAILNFISIVFQRTHRFQQSYTFLFWVWWTVIESTLTMQWQCILVVCITIGEGSLTFCV